MTLKERLYKPYYRNGSAQSNLILSVLFGLFVFLFLWIFRPFQLGQFQNVTGAAAGFGLVTLLTMIVLNVVTPLIAQSYFDQERWTVGKEILHSLLNLWLIGLLNFLFFTQAFSFKPNFYFLIWFQLVTVSVGIIPLTFGVILREKKLRQRYLEGSKIIEENRQGDVPISPNSSNICIRSKNQNEDIEIRANQLLYIQAADNYILVHYVNGEPTQKILRNGLKEVENDLKSMENMFRCHKSYLVNLDHIHRVSGNAQGYHLHLNHVTKIIPVSRQHNSIIKDKVSRTTK